MYTRLWILTISLLLIAGCSPVEPDKPTYSYDNLTSDQLLELVISGTEKEQHEASPVLTTRGSEAESVIGTRLSKAPARNDPESEKIKIRLLGILSDLPLADETLDLLTNITIEDTSPEVRWQSEFLLNQHRKEWINTLLPQFTDESPHHTRVLDILLRHNHSNGTSYITTLMKSRKTISVIAALNLIKKYEKRSLVPHVQGLLNHDKSTVRKLAVETIGQLGNEQDIPVIIMMLNDTDPGVRGKTAIALSQLSNESIPQIQENLDRETDPEAKKDMLTALDMHSITQDHN